MILKQLLILLGVKFNQALRMVPVIGAGSGMIMENARNDGGVININNQLKSYNDSLEQRKVYMRLRQGQ